MLYSNNKMVRINLVSKALFYFPLIGTTLVSILLSSRGSLLGLIGSVGAAFILIIIKNRKNKKFVITMCGIAIVGVCILATLYFTGVFDLFGDKRADGDNHLMVDKNYGQLHGDILRKIGCLGQAMELKEYLF